MRWIWTFPRLYCMVKNELKTKQQNLRLIQIRCICRQQIKDIEDICFFSVKDRNSFHRVDTIGYIFTSGTATCENMTDGVHDMN